ncbi:MAG: hypothetical protein QM758_17830 [Armatimonas sp.]
MTTDNLRTHVQVIAWLNIVLGIMSFIGGIVALVTLGGFGLLAAASAPHDPDAGAVGAMFGGFGAITAGIAIVMGLPSFLVGFGLLRYAPWSRIICIVLSILHLVNATTMGLSTVLGIYSLVILLQSDCAKLFRS